MQQILPWGRRCMEHLLANPALSIFHLLTLDLVLSRLKRVMIAMFGAGCRDV